METIRLVVSTTSGKRIEVNEFNPAGMSLVKPVSPPPSAFIPIPEGTKITTLQGRVPMAFDPDLQKSIRLHEYDGERIQPVAAILPPGYLQLYRPAYTAELDARRLPPAGYSLLGANDSGYVVAAISLQQEAQIIRVYETDEEDEIEQNIQQVKENENSRLYLALTSEKGVDIAAKFGSELEPNKLILSSRADLLAKHPATVKFFDSVYVEVNSFQSAFYERFQPSQSMSLQEALEFSSSLDTAQAGICYQVFPGLTDHPLEMVAMKDTLHKYDKLAVRLQNLPCDPEWYIEELALTRQHRQMVGITEWLKVYRQTIEGRG